MKQLMQKEISSDFLGLGRLTVGTVLGGAAFAAGIILFGVIMSWAHLAGWY